MIIKFHWVLRQRLRAHLSRLVLLASSTLLLAACGGGGGGGSSDKQTSLSNGGSTTGGSGSASNPSLQFSGSASSVASGSNVTLNWSSTNADTCTASGAWNGSRSLQGSASVGPITQSSTFTLSCSGANGGVLQEVVVGVTNSAVNVVLDVDQSTVYPGGQVVLNWSAPDADSCSASGAWSGSRANSGQFTTSALSQNASFSLTCQNAQGSAVDSVGVAVVGRTVSWVAPTANTDGTSLSDLSTYRLFWGANANSYTDSVDLASNVTTYDHSSFASGNYYFAVKAINSQGVESAFSNWIQKTLP